MKTRIFSVIGVISLVVSPVSGQVLFSESFDSAATADVFESGSGDTAVSYIDYSNFTIGATSHSLPEAPNQIAGSVATRGVVIQANITAGGASVVNLIAAEEPGGDPVSFSGDYRLTFDMYLSLDPTADRNSAGTTESGIWGVGNDAVNQVGYLPRELGVGTYGWLAVDSGFGSSDAAIWESGNQLGALGDQSNLTLFEDAFPDGAPIIPAPNNQWVAVEISVLGGDVIVSFNGVEFFREESAATGGFALIGYEDPFGSLSFSPDYQFGVFDNFVIERATPPTIVVTQTQGFAPVSADGATSTGILTVENTGVGALMVTGVNLGGDDSGNFSLVTGLPLSVPSGGSGEIEITYTAAGDRGVQSVEVEIVSTDGQTPSVMLTLEAVFAPVLLARYEFDEIEGTVVVDSSGNGVNGAFDIRDPLDYAQDSLAGDGTSIGFSEALFPDGGNFAFMNPLHVPTTSFSLWVEPIDDSSGEDTLFNRDPLFNAADAIYGCFINELGALVFRAGGEIVLQSPDGAVPDGEPSHIVITHLDETGFGNSTATRSRMYIDGVMVAENLSPTGFDEYPSGASTTNLFLTTRSAAGTGFTGLMDDVQIYSIELSAFQVDALFNDPGSIAIEGEEAEFLITDIDYDQGAAMVTLTWNSLPGRQYIVAESTDLQNWLDIEDGIMSQGLTTAYPTGGVIPGRRFYRVILQPQGPPQ